jgi:hypothetical protein
MRVLGLIFKHPYRPLAQGVYYAFAGMLGIGLLILGQPWAIGLAGMGCAGVALSGAGVAWRRRHPN